jgi:hypothetical protein
MFKQGDKIIVIPQHTPSTTGTIHSELDLDGATYYWVEYYPMRSDGPSPYKEVEPYSLEQLLKWNPHHNKPCDCGAESVGSDRHSTWCSKI